MLTSSILKTLSIAGFTAVATIGTFASASNAAVVGTYNFENSSNSASSVDPNLTFGGFTFTNASGSNSSTTFAPGNGGGLAYNVNTWGTNNALVPNTNNYLSFTVNANPGYVMNLDSIGLDQQANNNGPRNWQIRSDRDNYASAIGGELSTSTNNWASNSRTLGGANFTGLTNAVTFRIYAYNSVNNGNNGSWSVDNVTLNGSSAPVPEPLTIIGWGTALVAGGTLKRKFSSKKMSVPGKAS